MQSLISAGLLPAGTLVPTEEESSTTQPFSFYTNSRCTLSGTGYSAVHRDPGSTSDPLGARFNPPFTCIPTQRCKW